MSRPCRIVLARRFAQHNYCCFNRSPAHSQLSSPVFLYRNSPRYSCKSRPGQSQVCLAHSKRNFPGEPSRLKHSELQSSSGSTFLILVISSLAIGAAYYLYPDLPSRDAPESFKTPIPSPSPATFPPNPEDVLSYYEMTGQLPPGRPGNLTPDQEAKLRELWRATLQVFGVWEPAAAAAPAEAEANGSATPPAKTTEEKDKKKKSRLHMFRRSKTEKENEDSSAQTSSHISPTDLSQIDEDDKHGLGKEYKKAISTTSPEDIRKAFWSMSKHDHPDALLLRFLRARKWDVQAALIMMISTMHWRATEMHVDDDIMLNGDFGAAEDAKSSDPAQKKEGEMFLEQLRMGKSYLHGTDKDGRLLCVVRVKLHHAGDQSERSLERFTVYTMETARFMIQQPVDTATVVFDMTDFSMANMVRLLPLVLPLFVLRRPGQRTLTNYTRRITPP
jgi:hypothetical protein